MSGGVDSSVAAALLVDAGYTVIGVTLQIWPAHQSPPGRHVGCCSLDAVTDARRVARKLGIAHYVFDFEALFAREVIGPFTQAYLEGQTPNPCVWCNERVKFGALLDRARQLGCRWLATGHYARVEEALGGSRRLLMRARDRAKDQSYALWPLTQAQLTHVLFPLADLTKGEVRALARSRALPVASKPESQEICFIPDDDYRRFLRERAPGAARRPGEIVDRSGRVLGEHPGVAFFTVGQRKGLGIAAGRPLYVVAIDPIANRVIVGDRPDALSGALEALRPNWIGIESLAGPMRVEARIRRTAQDAPATIEPGSEPGSVRCTFDEPQWAVTPGQSVVWYAGDVVVGGAIIRRSVPPLLSQEQDAHTRRA